MKDLQTELQHAGIDKAVASRNTPAVFDWLLTTFSYQGVSDQVARTYIQQNGRATWSSLSAAFEATPGCTRLRSYWHFEGCRYNKGSFSCANPEQIADCLVPRPRLRNGRLNQTAASFFLFVRDITKSDLVGWIDQQLAGRPKGDRQQALIGPLRHIYGVSDKILTMALSDLLLGASSDRPVWFETGTGMIAIDTLVHNFLHRTGILHACGTAHQYGVGCYAQGGCADVIKNLRSGSTPEPLTGIFQVIFLGSFNTPFGGFALPTVSIFATATVSTTENRAKLAIATFSEFATENS